MPLPSEDTLRDLVAKYASVLAEHGEAFEGAELITPTAEHFPDRFERDGDSLVALLKRVASYTPLSDEVPLQIGLIEDGADDGHCTTGCAKPGARVDGVERVGGGYRLPLPMTELANPTRLVCALARGVSAAVLAEACVDVAPEEVGVMSEVTATASGFGVVLLEGSHVYAKSCGGPSIHRGTTLAPNELAVLLALFCEVAGADVRVARKHLGATQDEAMGDAADFVAANATLIRKLREAPELLVGGAFAIETKKKSLLSRFWGEREVEPQARAKRSAEDEQRLAEARALVEEELGTR